MDAAELLRRIDAARAFELEVDGVVWCALTPRRGAILSAGLRAGAADWAGTNVLLVCEHLTGWRGMTAARLGLPGEEAVAFDARLARVYLEAHPEATATLVLAMLDRLAQRAGAAEDERKN